MPVGEIKAGMVGIGRTVFEGAELQEFKAHILGVLHNVQGPHRDLILARLEGGPLAEDRRRGRHERQPGLHRRPADRRGVVLDRIVPDGSDRRHYAYRRDEGRDRDGAAVAPTPQARIESADHPRRSHRRA